MQRIFLIGCPRSGTTIFQSLLAAHPEVESFPETKVFQYALWDRFQPRFSERLHQFFVNEIKRPDLLKHFNKNQSTTTSLILFISVLDQLTIEKQKKIWVEKTPEHIFFIPNITDLLPQAKFIHVVRNGLDTIASLYAATRMIDSQLWGGTWSLNYCIARWKDSTKITQQYANNKQHLVVKYEDLLIDKVETVKACCEFLAVKYSNNIFTNYKKEALRLSMGLAWHDGINSEIKAPLIPRHRQIFQQHEIDYILGELEIE